MSGLTSELAHETCAWIREFCVSSTEEEVIRVRQSIVAAVQDRGFTVRECVEFEIALTEALQNGMQHGNGFNSEKRLHVACHVTVGEVRVEVQDEGDGFRPDDVADPTLPENLVRGGGRGILMMKCFLDGLHYNDTGNRVTLHKRRRVADLQI